MRTEIARLLGRFLDWLGYRLFGHLDDVDLDIELHEAEQRVIAEATQICREAARRKEES